LEFMNEPAASSSVAPQQAGPARRGPAILGIAATLLLALTAMTMLLIATLRVPAVQHVLVVRSGPEWEGVQLIVEGEHLTLPMGGSIEKLGNFIVPFYLPAGVYTLYVRDRGELLHTEEVNLSIGDKEIDLARIRSASRPTTRPRDPADRPDGA
jgi:hypothetical protein